MIFQQFLDALDGYGPDLERWPDSLRAEGRTIAATPEGEAALTAAAEVDRLLLATRAAGAGSGAIASRAMEHRQGRRRAGGRWLAIGGAAALGFGIACGSTAALAEAGSGALNAAFDTGVSDGS